MRPTTALVTHVSGDRSRVASSMTRKRYWISAVAHSRATALGITSPKISISGVSTRVATAAAAPPSTGSSAHVATDDAVTWAMVTPIMAVESTFSGWRKLSR